MVYWTLVVEIEVLRADVAGDRYATDEARGVSADARGSPCAAFAVWVPIPHWLDAVLMPMYAALFSGGCFLYLIRSRGVDRTPADHASPPVLPLSMYWTLQYQAKYTHSTSLGTQLTVDAIILGMSLVLLLLALRRWSLPRARAVVLVRLPDVSALPDARPVRPQRLPPSWRRRVAAHGARAGAGAAGIDRDGRPSWSAASAGRCTSCSIAAYRLLEKLGRRQEHSGDRDALGLRLRARRSLPLSSRARTRCWRLPLLVATSARDRCRGQASAPARPRREHRRAAESGPLNAITDVAGVRVGHHADQASTSDRSDGDRAARRQSLPGKGAGGHLRRQRLRQVHGLDPGQRARRDRDADPAHQHAERLPQAPSARRWTLACPAMKEVRSINAGRRRDQRRLPQRHPRRADHADNVRSRRSSGAERAGRRRHGRRRHRHGRVRLEGRHRHQLARAAAALGGYTVGVLVQTNYGGVLTIAGVPCGRARRQSFLAADRRRRATGGSSSSSRPTRRSPTATSTARQPGLDRHRPDRLAMTNGSGDYVIAFST